MKTVCINPIYIYQPVSYIHNLYKLSRANFLITVLAISILTEGNFGYSEPHFELISVQFGWFPLADLILFCFNIAGSKCRQTNTLNEVFPWLPLRTKRFCARNKRL
jgi:hypothetical protein